ncbi:MAG: hypothetical protein LC775_05375, partial [Acidobacteria bacterium]|nr:hypothetical protein [Acidobacteriota bacterium]
PGIVLGPAILGFTKAVADTLLGNVRYETSLLRSENDQEEAQSAEDQVQEDAPQSRVAGAVN